MRRGPSGRVLPIVPRSWDMCYHRRHEALEDFNNLEIFIFPFIYLLFDRGRKGRSGEEGEGERILRKLHAQHRA